MRPLRVLLPALGLSACGLFGKDDAGTGGSEGDSPAGTWNVTDFTMASGQDSTDADELIGGPWTGTLAIRDTLVGTATFVAGDETWEFSLALEAEDGGTWRATADAMDLRCTLAGDAFDCADAGETDWSESDWDSHWTYLYSDRVE